MNKVMSRLLVMTKEVLEFIKSKRCYKCRHKRIFHYSGYEGEECSLCDCVDFTLNSSLPTNHSENLTCYFSLKQLDLPLVIDQPGSKELTRKVLVVKRVNLVTLPKEEYN